MDTVCAFLISSVSINGFFYVSFFRLSLFWDSEYTAKTKFKILNNNKKSYSCAVYGKSADAMESFLTVTHDFSIYTVYYIYLKFTANASMKCQWDRVEKINLVWKNARFIVYFGIVKLTIQSECDVYNVKTNLKMHCIQ